MMKTIVRCRCGYRVRARDVLRTDFGSRFLSDFVWIKYRCRRCKHLSELLVDEDRFDRSLLFADKREMSEPERDKFAEAEAISVDDLLDFRSELAQLESLNEGTITPKL